MSGKKVSVTKKSEAKKSGYGWMPDLPDHRDILYSVVCKIPAKLPPSVDLRPKCSDRKSTRLNSSHSAKSRMPSSA